MRCACGVENEDTNTFCTGCGERLIRGTPAANLGDQTAAANPDVTRLADLDSPPEAEREAKTRLTESHTVNTDQSQVKDQVAPTEWKVGDVILDLYEVKQIHESGGMGRVYRVHHRQWNTDLAVKSPRVEAFETDAHRENFVRECETWIQLGMHPHIVSCHYVRSINDVPHVFAEYVEGGSLHDWIEDKRLYNGGEKEALKRMLDISIQFAWGLHYAHTHEQGLIHQDVKPGNVLITSEGEVKVTDFGLARARAAVGEDIVAEGGGRTVFVPGPEMMTPAYCSPEQAEGKTLSRKTDIWSWGLCILEMFKGERTWESGTLAMVALDEYLNTGAEDKSIPRMPDSLAKLLKKCFQQNPENRPEDFHEIANELQSIYKEECKFGEYPLEEPKAVELLADGLNNHALSMLDLGREAEAEKAWEAALEADPQHLEATYNRGVVLWRKGRISDDALVHQLEEVRKTHIDEWRDEYLLAQVQLERGDIEAAEKLLEEAAEKNPNAPEVEAALLTVRAGDSHASCCVRTFKGLYHSRGVNFVTMSADGRWVFSASGDAYDTPIQMLEAGTGQLVRTFEGHESTTNALCLSGDNRWLLSGSNDKTLRLWEVATGQCIRILKAHEGRDGVSSACLSADGRFALSGGSDKDDEGRMRFWELATGRCVQTFEGHKIRALSVSLSEDSRWALSGSYDKTLRLWEVATGQCVRTFEGHMEWVTSVSLSADGRWALSGSKDTTLRLWEVSTGRCVRTFEGHTGLVCAVSLSADGLRAVSGSEDKTLRLWEVSTGRCVRTFGGHKDSVKAVSLSKDGRWALSGENGVASNVNYGVNLWKLPRKFTSIYRLCPSRPGIYSAMMEQMTRGNALLGKAAEALNEARITDAVRAMREARALSGLERTRETTEIWSRLSLVCPRSGLRSAWHQRTFQGHSGVVECIDISQDGRWALSGSSDKTLRLWEVSTGRCVQTLEGHENGVLSVSLSGDNRWAVSLEHPPYSTLKSTQTLHLWELVTGRCIRTIEIPAACNYNIFSLFTCLSGDGRWVLTAGKDRKAASLWEVSTGRCVRTFEGHSDDVISGRLSADGRWALTGSAKNVSLWEISTARRVRIFQWRPKVEYGRNTRVLKWVQYFSADGRWMLSGGGDGTLKLWDVAAERCSRTFQAHKGAVKSVCLSADRRWALSVEHSAKKTFHLWEVATGRCVWTFEGHTAEVTMVCLSGDGRWVLSASNDKTVRLWELDWELEAREAADWDEAARPYLESFLTLHTPYTSDDPMTPEGLTRRGRPSWTEEDFQCLIRDLQHAGYGWLRPDGVKRELEKMAATWEGPPPLPWELSRQSTQSKTQEETIVLSAKNPSDIPKQEQKSKAVPPSREVFIVAPKTPRKVVGPGKSVSQNVLNELIIEVMADDVRGERVIKDPRPDIAIQKETLGLYNEKLASATECPKCKKMNFVSFFNKSERQLFHMCFNCGFDDRNANRKKAQPSSPAAPTRARKIGRQDPCPCGSGKKYKHCCGA